MKMRVVTRPKSCSSPPDVRPYSCASAGPAASCARTTFRGAFPSVAPLAAYLDLQPEATFPSLFAPGTIGADIRPRAGADMRSWQRQVERESHKIVARAWGIPVERVFDRFTAERRRQRRLAAAGIAAALLITLIGILVASGQWGLHRVRELALNGRVVAPVCVGFSGKSEAVLVGSSIQSWPL